MPSVSARLVSFALGTLRVWRTYISEQALRKVRQEPRRAEMSDAPETPMSKRPTMTNTTASPWPTVMPPPRRAMDWID
jgi:hypothetical protein